MRYHSHRMLENEENVIGRARSEGNNVPCRAKKRESHVVTNKKVSLCLRSWGGRERGLVRSKAGKKGYNRKVENCVQRQGPLAIILPRSPHALCAWLWSPHLPATSSSALLDSTSHMFFPPFSPALSGYYV